MPAVGSRRLPPHDVLASPDGNRVAAGCDDGDVGVIAVVVVGIAVLVGVALVLGLTDSPMSTEPPDRLDSGVPADRQLTSADVGGLRFRVGLRGYRMDDVDRALDRLRDALHESEQRVAPPGEPAEEVSAPDQSDGA